MPSKNSKPSKKQKNRGLFITLEGGDGAGKTLLIDRLESARGALKTRNPGGTPLGEKIRALILHEKSDPATPYCELLLYLADRAQHVEKVVIPTLESGKTVLCDRFNDSTIAYQVAGRDLPADEVKRLCSFASFGIVPDLTLYLDIDPVLGLERIKKTRQEHDRLEEEKLAFHEAVRQAYLNLAKQEPDRFRVLDASLSPDEVFTQAQKEIDAYITSTTL